LRPYVQGGSKFFVAKVNVEKVRFDKGMAKLSPLRFHYDTESFNLPVRLGLINANGKQDLIVHILARNARYELANYKNVTIPTNLDVDEGARGQFGTFYAALFDRTLEENPGAIVTEYAWDASTCDPCPGPSLSPNDLATFGMDVLPQESDNDSVQPPPPPRPPISPFLDTKPSKGARANPPTTDPLDTLPAPPRPRPRPRWRPSAFVLTRLHARYGADSLGEDLVFRKAEPIVGGREFMQSVPQSNTQGTDERRLETGSQRGNVNNFQGRYAIRHPWKGPITCENPRRGIWGGPPAGTAHGQTTVARDLAFAPREGAKLASFVRHDVPEIRLQGAPITMARVTHAGAAPQSDAKPTTPASAQDPATTPAASTGCGACTVGENGTVRGSGVFLGVGVVMAGLLRRRRRGA
jgi:MYXO-CTERM domain-containing protein